VSKLVEVATGVSFEFSIRPGELDAFNHPYAYLPGQTTDPRQESPAASTLA
jgi:hypothetical protein